MRDIDPLLDLATGLVTASDVEVGAGDTLRFRGRRYLRAADPDDRAWPVELGTWGAT
jgi:hypothetical protein